jgi:hypothetical protein
MNISTSTTSATAAQRLDRVTSTGYQTNPRGRWISVVGALYVGSWVAGLVLAPETPGATASGDQIHHYYATQGSVIVAQSSLIHGLAGIALAVLAFGIPAATSASPGLSRMIRAFGVAAAAVSLLQVAFAVVGVATASFVATGTSARLFDDLNLADTVKLALIAAFAATVAVAAGRAAMIGRWTRLLTAALVAALPIGGAAFIVDNPALTAVLYLSLPLLLLWVGVIAWRVGLRAH